MRSRLLLLFALPLLLSACIFKPSPVVTISGHDAAVSNGYAEIIADSTLGDAVFEFSSRAGYFPSVTGNRAVWRAPRHSGEYAVVVTGVSGSKFAVAERKVVVKVAPVEIHNPLVWHMPHGREAHMDIKNTGSRTVTSVRMKAIMANTLGQNRFQHDGQYVFDLYAANLSLAPGDTRTHIWFPGFLESGYHLWVWPYEVTFSDGSRWQLYD